MMTTNLRDHAGFELQTYIARFTVKTLPWSLQFLQSHLSFKRSLKLKYLKQNNPFIYLNFFRFGTL